MSAPADSVSIDCTIEKETEGGAWQIFDGMRRAYVPKASVALSPETAGVGDRATVTMTRRLAVQKRFDAGKDPDQGRLL